MVDRVVRIARMAFPLVFFALAACGRSSALSTASYPQGEKPGVFPAVDRAEVYELDADDERPREEITDWGDRFPVTPHSSGAKIKSVKKLDAAGSQRFVDAWRHLRFDDRTQYLCHHPAFGLRFYEGDHLILQTTLCLSCWNFWDASGSWRGIDFRKPEGAAFYASLREVVPTLPAQMLMQAVPISDEVE